MVDAGIVVTAPAVRMTIFRVDVARIASPWEPLEAFEGDQGAVYEAAHAWAQVRGYDRALDALEQAGARKPPTSGFNLLFNRPHGLAFYAQWPWCLEPNGAVPQH